MEDKQGRTSALFKDAGVEAHFFPGRKLFRLALRQPCFHRKLGFREVQGAFQVHSFCHLAGFANPFWKDSGILWLGYVSLCYEFARWKPKFGIAPRNVTMNLEVCQPPGPDILLRGLASKMKVPLRTGYK